jgi:hypothetical protein
MAIWPRQGWKTMWDAHLHSKWAIIIKGKASHVNCVVGTAFVQFSHVQKAALRCGRRKFDFSFAWGAWCTKRRPLVNCGCVSLKMIAAAVKRERTSVWRMKISTHITHKASVCDGGRAIKMRSNSGERCRHSRAGGRAQAGRQTTTELPLLLEVQWP